MNKEIQEGRTCTLYLNSESSSAIEFGDHMFGKVIGKDVVDASRGTLNEMYQTQNRVPVIIIEDEAGLLWKVPERDVDRIVCGEEQLC
jgi:hypothetical protein